MNAFVVDTNVPMVANDRSHQSDPDCVLNCLRALEEVRSGIVVLDDGMRILDEYMGNLSMSGQPGAGNAFMKWVWEIQAAPAHCERVFLTPRDGGDDDFAEFPSDPSLDGFDRSDRKFVAAARASKLSPPILNAVDRDWWEYRTALKKHNVTVQFLCPHLLGRTRRRSKG